MMEDLQNHFYEALNKMVKGSSMKIYYRSKYENVWRQIVKANESKFCSIMDQNLMKVYKVAVIDGKNRLIPAVNETSRIVCYVHMEEIYSILQETHIRLKHANFQRMFNDIKYKYVNITIDIIQLYVSFCKACQSKMKSLDDIMYQEMNSRVQLDIIHVKPHYDGDYKYILSYEDYKTKYCFLRPLKSACPNEVSVVVVDILTTIGAPNIIQTNRGSKFTQSLIQLLTEMWPYLRIVPGHSTHDDNEILRSLIFKHHKSIKSYGDYRWSQVLGFIQIKKNRSFNVEIQQTPFEAMFGRAAKIGLLDSVVSKKDIASVRNENDLRTVLCSYINDKCASLNISSDDDIEITNKIVIPKEESTKKNDDARVEEINFIGYEVEGDKAKKTKLDVKEKIVNVLPKSPGLSGRQKEIKLREIENTKDIEVVYINEKPPVRINSQSVDDPLIIHPNTKGNLKKTIKSIKGNNTFLKNNSFLTNNKPVIISEDLELQRHIKNIKMDHSYVVDDAMAVNDSMDADQAMDDFNISNPTIIKTTEDIENFIFANTLDKGAAFKETTIIKSEVTNEFKNVTKRKAGGKTEQFEIQTVPDNSGIRAKKSKIDSDLQSSQIEVLAKKDKVDEKVKLNYEVTKRVTRSSTRLMNMSKPAVQKVTNFDTKNRKKCRKSTELDENCKELRKDKTSISYEQVDGVKQELIEEVDNLLGENETLPAIDLSTFQSLQHPVLPNANMASVDDVNDDDVDEDLAIYGHLIDPITGDSTVEKYFVGCSCPTDCKKNNKCPCKLKSILCNVKCHNDEKCKN